VTKGRPGGSERMLTQRPLDEAIVLATRSASTGSRIAKFAIRVEGHHDRDRALAIVRRSSLNAHDLVFSVAVRATEFGRAPRRP
jgi:hypothetical protein